MTKHRRRKEDKIKDADKSSIHFLYSDPDIIKDNNGEYKVVRRFSWKKLISSSLFGFIIAWSVWCTSSIFSDDTRISVTSQKVNGITKNLVDEIQERKDMDVILHKRITKTDDFSRDQIRMLQKSLHDYRMATFDKVDNAKETLINMMIKILENQEQIKKEK